MRVLEGRLGMAISVAAVIAISTTGGLGLPVLLSVLIHAGVFELLEAVLSGGDFDSQCFFAGLLAGLSPFGILLIPIFGSVGAALGYIISALGYANALLDLDGSRAGCLGG